MQNIKFDFKDLDDIELTVYELHSVMEFASAYPTMHLRVTRDENNLLLIYVGAEPGREDYRFTIYINGDLGEIQNNQSLNHPDVDSDKTQHES